MVFAMKSNCAWGGAGSFRRRVVIGAAEAQECLGANQTTKPKLWQVLSLQGEPI